MAKIAVFDFDNITKDCEIEEVKVYVRYKKPDGERYEMISDKFAAVVTFENEGNKNG